MPEKKLYRSRPASVGGVCTGIATYFNLDPIVVQILTVVLAIATGGLLLIAYVALWIILPPEPGTSVPVDVQPHAVHSDTYGQVEYGAPSTTSTQGTYSSSSDVFSAQGGAAHIPPVPPRDFTSSSVPSSAASSYVTIPFAQGTQADFNGAPGTASAPVSPSAETSPFFKTSPMPAQNAPETAPVPPPPPTPSVSNQKSSSHGALWLGILLLFVGLCALLGVTVPGVSWWQFWPLFFVLTGIGEMVVPGEKGHRMGRFVNGLMQFSLGVALLFFSLEVVSIESCVLIFTELWPLLVVMSGLFILGGALKAPFLTLLAGFCFVAFCVVGIGWFSLPGSNEIITFMLPTGHSYCFTLHPW